MSSPDGVFYITTPIYYVNDRPHIGHAYCTILADVLTRFNKAFGRETFFLTGVDEHGQKVEEAAKRRGMTPLAHCDDMQTHFRSLWPTLDIQHDDFIRTTEERHEKVVQQALARLWEKGEIYRGEYEGFYSPRVEKFFTEDELVDGKCPETGGEVFKLKEANYFFKMSAYQERLIRHIEENPDFIVPQSRRNEILGFLRKPLQDLCISRPKSRLSWGIELPFDRDYVTYVWFDALLNYTTAVGLYTDDARFAKWWPRVRHLIGKDILTTHSVYWTTMLMAMDLPLPHQIIAHGWWLVDGGKMSKSEGKVVSPLDMKAKYGTDSLRYFLMREMVVGLDADFSEEAFLKRHNYELANDLGNLANRLVKFAAARMGGVVPAVGEGSGFAVDADLRDEAVKTVEKVRQLVGDLRIETAIEVTMNFVRRINRYVSETEPFKVIADDPAKAGAAVYNALEALRWALNLLAPVMPSKTAELLVAIGAGGPLATFAELEWGGLKPGSALNLPNPPFPRHDVPDFAAPVAQAVPKVEENLLGYDDFAKLDLRIGTVLATEAVAKSDKLLKMSVDLGEAEPRQIVAGIAQAYPNVAGLVGRQFVVVANLQPRKVFGILSNGMILAAHDPDGLSVLGPDRKVSAGSKIS